MDSLSERLKALGFIPASKIEKPSSSLSGKDFAAILEAQEVQNRLGVTHLIEKQYPSDYQHGAINFRTRSELTSLSRAARVNPQENADLSKLLFLDTETTGLSGGTGTLAFLVGLGYFAPEGFLLKQYLLKDTSQEPAMLAEILSLSDHFSGIVTFNGKAFDIPLLKTRLVINRLPNPFESKAHFDLLYISRRIWKNRLPSRALQDLEREILNISRTEDEVPGWMIPQLYFDFLRNNDPLPLKNVAYHNGMDILSLAALFLHLASALENVQNVDQFNPIDYYSLGQLFYDLGFKEIALKIFLECDSQDCLPTHLKLHLYQRLGEVYKSQADYDSALIFWKKAASFEDIPSLIEIAKVYEHIFCEYPAALEWTETAITFLTKKGYHSYQERSLAKELVKRKDRLSKKIERKNGYVSEKN